MSVIHISGAEAARDFEALLARVRAGDAVVIEDEVCPPVVLRVAEEPRGRTLSESLRLARQHAKESGFEPVMDADFAADVEERIRAPQAARHLGVGLVLDSSVLIASERRSEALDALVLRLQRTFGEETEVSLSAISIVKVTHGVYRAQTATHRSRRSAFVDELCRDLVVHPVTLEIARLAGRIEGEQAAQGVIIAFEDLVIGATALHLSFDLATLNVRHFQRIPGLNVVTL